jgi:aspartate/methionine/tyrosine aminotransferase
MNMTYLEWYKTLDLELTGRENCYRLLSSGVEEPLDLLHGHVKKYYDDVLKVRLDEPNPWGHPSLIEHLSFKYGISQKKILPASGTSNALYLAMLALVERGDRVIIEAPMYEPLITVAEQLGAQIVFTKRKAPDYQIDMDNLSDLITPKTKMIVLTNLHNPSGAFIREEQLLAIAELARTKGNGAYVLVDEVYHDFVIGVQPSAASMADNMVSVASLTKVFGLSLLRCGWVFASPKIIEKIRPLYLTVEGIGSRYMEVVSSIVVEHLDEYIAYSRELVGQNRMYLWDALEPVLKAEILSPNIPENGCIYFPNVANLADTREFVQDLAGKYQVYVVPGYLFGEPKAIRIGFGGKPDQFKVAIERFAEGAIGIIGK